MDASISAGEWLLTLLLTVYSLFVLLRAPGARGSSPISPLELAIFITGIASVWLAARERVANWPVGILNVILWIVLFLQQRLFANAGLQIVYIVTGALGWSWWLHGGDSREALVIAPTPAPITGALAFGCLAFSYPAMLLLNAIGGNATYWDGITTLLSLAGQYLLMKKRLENWLFWIVADVIYIGLFLQQRLFLSAQLYLLFLVMAIAGWFGWRSRLLQPSL